jgi:hypothetical protein
MSGNRFYCFRMNCHKFLVMLVALSLTACPTTEDQVKKSQKKRTPPQNTLVDQSGDVSFQSFLGLLRKAVANRDRPMLASMMTGDFGYRIEPVGEGAGVFDYWDQNNLWPELSLVLREKFVPKGAYMVSPPQFALMDDYRGYRAGIINISGSWKFAYFVND